MILSDRQIGLKRVSEALNNLYDRVDHTVQIDLDTRQIFAKWTPISLNVNQKNAMVEASLDLRIMQISYAVLLL